MRRLSPKLAYGMTSSYMHYCPACKGIHYFPVDKPGGIRGNQRWSFNGNVELPTFHPSMNINQGDCHYWLQVGKITFCPDSRHDMRGQTVDLPDLPDWFASDCDEENDDS